MSNCKITLEDLLLELSLATRALEVVKEHSAAPDGRILQAMRLIDEISDQLQKKAPCENLKQIS